MFENIMGTMGKLRGIKQKADEARERLSSVLLGGSTANRGVRVTIITNRGIKSVSISGTPLEDKEALEGFLMLILNKAIARTTEEGEAALVAVTK